jgi:hypothetical protein
MENTTATARKSNSAATGIRALAARKEAELRNRCSLRDTIMEQASILVANTERTYEGIRNLVETLASLPPANAIAITVLMMTELEFAEDGINMRAMLLTASLDAAVAVRS